MLNWLLWAGCPSWQPTNSVKAQQSNKKLPCTREDVEDKFLHLNSVGLRWCDRDSVVVAERNLLLGDVMF